MDASPFNYPSSEEQSPLLARSLSSTRPGTSLSVMSRPATCPASRPATASGRKSRTTNTSSIGNSESQTIVCAVAEARGISPSVGVAVINVSLGEVTLSQICDNQSYVKTIHKLQVISPSKVLFQSQACPPNQPSTLFTLLEELVPSAEVVPFDRNTWSETSGLEFIQDLAFQNDIESIKVAIQGKFYAIASFSAVMKYTEYFFSINFVPQSLRIRYQPSENTMMIDISAMQSLEIMQNQRKAKSKDCLLGLLDHTLTPMGTRLLRSNVLQPPTRPDLFLNPRFDAVEELIADERMFREIRKALKPFFNVERLLTQMIIVPTIVDVPRMEELVNQVLMIKHFLEAVPQLFQALEPAQAALLVKVRDLCQPEIYTPIVGKIRRVIEKDVTYVKSPLDLRNQRTFAVKAGISGMLDVARQTYKELTEDIHTHVAELNRKLRLKAIDFENGDIPEVIINAVRKKDHIECQTLNLVKLNLRLSDTSNETVLRSDAVIQDLMDDLRLDVPHLFRICESVALIDMVAAFGHLSIMGDYVRPEITGTLALKAARHPILAKGMTSSLVPNDYYSTDQYCFHVVTGPNMSGKSIYIRTVALLQIMAQIGCFVPAQYASFSIVHNIFARVSMDDNIEANLSTFSVEMREMAFLLRNVQGNSLAVIDELGRGTSTRDGLAIALAMSEALVQSKASVWFATHFDELARVMSDRPGVLALHLASKNSTTEDGMPHTTMLYKATRGGVDQTVHYGINLARAMGFPAAFVHRAEGIANDLRNRREANRQNSEYHKLSIRRRLILNLHEALQQARECGSEEVLPGYLERLQQEFVVRMEEVDNM